MPDLFEVARKSIDEVLLKHGGNTKFVIYPFGEGGKIIKGILNYEYKIKEIAIIDNYLYKNNSEIRDLSFLNNHQDVIVLISSYRSDSFENIRKSLYLHIPQERCVEVYDRNILGAWFYPEILRLTKIHDAKKQLVRIGSKNDGGYIMVDDLHGDIAYSFGIGDNLEWDLIMAEHGYDIYMYDHTVCCPQSIQKYKDKMHFFKKGISDSVVTDDLKTLDDLIVANNHQNKDDMILKMDVEGAEWGFLGMVSSHTLMNFRQLIFEFHNMNSIDEVVQKNIVRGLLKFYSTHRAIHIHGNNWGGCVKYHGHLFPDACEITYLRKDLVGQPLKNVQLPLGIDSPCNDKKPDILLGDWNLDQQEKEVP